MREETCGPTGLQVQLTRKPPDPLFWEKTLVRTEFEFLAMVRAIERIEQDIVVLEQAIAATAEELYRAYESYLTHLGQAVRQQLIMASYHLCTQGYPQQFLQLPFQQRQQLQQDLKQLAHRTQQSLQECLTAISADELAEETPDSPAQAAQDVSPLEALGRWQVQLERSLAGQLRLASRKANQRLTDVGILSGEFPDAIIEAALKSEAVNDMMPGPPNILTLVLGANLSGLKPETEESVEAIADDPDSDPAEDETAFPLRIMVLRLRLADIEFADSLVMAGRTQIRNLLSRLAGLDRDYEKKQQERAIAAAEAAWRASWTDEL